MTRIEQAFSVLDQALNAASKAGAYGIQDAVMINSALTILKDELTSAPNPELAEEQVVGPKKVK